MCKVTKEIHELRYAWIDTCCIDKKSSSELSEAINSIFDWYRKAELCLAYLDDVTLSNDAERDLLRHDLNAVGRNDEFTQQFIHYRWFTRGWTLQELLAPHYLIFYDRRWRRIAKRREVSFLIQAATGIEPHELEPDKFQSASVARRMSWAAKRKTRGSRTKLIVYLACCCSLI